MAPSSQHVGHDIAQALAAQTLAAPQTAASGSGLPFLTAQFLTLAADASLTAERIFTAGSGLSAVDSGAGAAYTLSLGTPSTLTVASTNTASGTTHTHAVTSSSAPGAAASLLATDGSGNLTLSATLRLNGTLDFGGDVDLSRKGANILQFNSGDSVESLTYTSGLAGWHIDSGGNAEFQNVRVRGELAASVFRVSEITATAGTLGVFKSAATLYADYTAPGSVGSSNTLTARNSAVGGSLLAANDVIRIKSYDGTAVRDLWFTVTAVGTNHGSNTDYTVRLESGTTGVVFTAGTAVADYGPSGSGFLTQSADGTVGSSANLTIADHAGSPWSTTTLRVRLGNLNGSFGLSSDLYGIGIGDYAGGNYLKYDGTNGFTLKAGNNNVTIDADGIKIVAPSSSVSTDLIGWTSGGSVVNGLVGLYSAGSYTQLFVQAAGIAANDQAAIHLNAQGYGQAGQFELMLVSPAGAVSGYLSAGNFTGGGQAFGGLILGATATTTTPSAMLDVRGNIKASSQVWSAIDGNTGGFFAGATGDVHWYRDTGPILRSPNTVTIDGGLNLGSASGASAGQFKSSANIWAAIDGNTGGFFTGALADVQWYRDTGSVMRTPNKVQVDGAFGCNTKGPQTAYASGGALAAYVAGANGLDTGAHMSALVTLVTNIRAALVADGIMS